MFGGALVLRELASPGTRVKVGDTVAEFDREDMLTRVDDFKAQIVQAEASMRNLRAQLAVIQKAHAQTIFVSRATLDKAGLDLKTIPVQPEITAEGLRLSAEEAGATHTQLSNEVQFMETSLQSQMRIAEMDMQETKAEFKRLQENADKMILRAPLDGIVVMRTTYRGGEQGQIMKGDQLFPGQSLMQIVDTSSMLVYSSVNQVDAEAMKIGAKATVHFDAFPDLELPATVRAIGAISTASGWRGSYVKQIPVTLKLDRLDPRVIPDLSVSADVVLGSEQGGVITPIESVFQDGAGSRPFVFVRTPTGWERRDVELGLSSYVAVAVRAGVRAGEIVALERPVMISTQ
jgi:HlyD family secretion protein